jgi:hypothetical protein
MARLPAAEQHWNAPRPSHRRPGVSAARSEREATGGCREGDGGGYHQRPDGRPLDGAERLRALGVQDPLITDALRAGPGRPLEPPRFLDPRCATALEGGQAGQEAPRGGSDREDRQPVSVWPRGVERLLEIAVSPRRRAALGSARARAGDRKRATIAGRPRPFRSRTFSRGACPFAYRFGAGGGNGGGSVLAGYEAVTSKMPVPQWRQGFAAVTGKVGSRPHPVRRGPLEVAGLIRGRVRCRADDSPSRHPKRWRPPRIPGGETAEVGGRG